MRNVYSGFASCLSVIFVYLGLMLTVGALCFQYVLFSIFAKDAPWYLDLLGGVFLGGLAIPATVICFILRSVGVEVPFYH